jgi:hypothetical protein
MASLVLSVVYATDQRRNHRLYPRHLHLSGVRAGVPGLQRVGDPDVGGVRWLRIATRFAHHIVVAALA